MSANIHSFSRHGVMISIMGNSDKQVRCIDVSRTNSPYSLAIYDERDMKAFVECTEDAIKYLRTQYPKVFEKEDGQ